MAASTPGNSREYCLRWNNHQPNLVTFFGDLLHKESLVDVTLVSSEGKKLQAHKLVLSSCSSYFQHVFENNPCKHPVVILKDVLFADLRTIVNFIYNGEVNISQDRINTILSTATTLQVKGLAEVPPDELKRVSVKSESLSTSSVRTQQPPPLLSSHSWAAGDGESLSQGEIPRKKLKKSTSATVSSGSISVSTNGEHGTSFDSGASASMNRSVDDGGNGRGISPPARSSVPGPPPLTAANQFLSKSRSLDRNLECVNVDSELSSGSGTFSENQPYDESSLGADRGYDLEVADMKIETVSDGDIEYEEESFGHPENLEFMELNQSNPFPNAPSSSSFYHQPLRHFASSPVGGKGRRGRLLIRQPRIKRVDNDNGRETIDIYTGECYENTGNVSGGETSEPFPNRTKSLDETSTRYTPTITSSVNVVVVGGGSFSSTDRSISPTHSVQTSVPIVRVSQCSPTPPSSPVDCVKQEIISVSVPTISFSSSSSVPSSSSIVHTSTPPSSSSTTLLTVPTESGNSHSFTLNTSSSSHLGSHLVKQISQPLLPSHTTAVSLGSSGNPVIRRQHSQPSPSQHQQQHHQIPSRIVPYSPTKRGALFTLVPSENFRSSSTSSSCSTVIKEDDLSPSTSPSSQSTFILEPSTSYIHLVSQADSGRFASTSTMTATTSRSDSSEHMIKKAKKDLSAESGGSSSLSAAGGSFSSEDSISGEGMGDDGNPLQRSGHCPVLRQGPALGCNFCWNSVDSCGRIFRRKTKYHCPECHINLCIVPCFQEYHEKADKMKKKSRAKLGQMKPASSM